MTAPTDSSDDSDRKERALPGPSRVPRTLLGAAIGAVLAMLFVPHVRYPYADYYRLIFDASGKIDVPQLVLNVVFAALVCALAANLSRRAALWAARSMLGVALVVAAWFGFSAYQEQMKTGAEREEGIAFGAIKSDNFEVAKEHLLRASNYWWWKGWWYGARNARERAFDEQTMKKDAAVFWAQKEEEGAALLLQKRWWNKAWHSPPDDDITKAKQLLLDAAEKWHIAENTVQEQRVRAKEKDVRYFPPWVEFSDLVPKQPEKRNQYLSTDPFDPDAYLAGKTQNPFDQFDAAAHGSGAAHPKAYRVTGPALEVTDTMIAVQKGTDRWQIARDSNTKVTGDLKVGATVTITYTMTAAEVAVKPSKDIFDRLSPSDFPDQPQKPR